MENFIKLPRSLVGGCYLELVESGDRGAVSAHLAQAACLPDPPAVSECFRLRLAPDRAPIRVTARSRLFRAKPSSGEPDFIMSTHSVLSDDDGPETPAPAAPPRTNGDPDGERYRPASPQQPFSINDFDLDPWAATLLGDMPDETKERKAPAAGESSAPRTPAPAEPAHHLHQQHSQHQPQPHHMQHEEPTRLRSILTGKNHILIGILRQEDEENNGGGGEGSNPQTPHAPHTPQSPAHPRAPLAPHGPQGPHAGPSSHSHQQHNPLVRVSILLVFCSA